MTIRNIAIVAALPLLFSFAFLSTEMASAEYLSGGDGVAFVRSVHHPKQQQPLHPRRLEDATLERVGNDGNPNTTFPLAKCKVSFPYVPCRLL